MSQQLQLPANLSRWVPRVPWLQVVPGPEGLLRLGQRIWRLHVVQAAPPVVGEGDSAWKGAWDEPKDQRKRPRAELTVVARPYLSLAIRKELAARGLGYADSHGHFHLEGAGLLIHIDEDARKPQRSESQSTIGVDGVRTVQTILGEPVRNWSVTELASQARVSQGHAHRILSMLEREGFMVAEDRGPRKRRRLLKPTELVDWLIEQRSARRSERKVEVALYARTPGELWSKVTETLERAGIACALTGAAAAALFDVGPSTVQRSVFRVNPDMLDDAPDVLRVEETTRGANLVLMSDTGLLGTLKPERKKDVLVAPAIRIYLDCFAEKRGEDVATAFRESVLGF